MPYHVTHELEKWPTHRAIEFDSKPALRYLICKRSPLLEKELSSVADAYLGGRDYYLPSLVLPQSVLEAARLACRFPVSLITYCRAGLSHICLECSEFYVGAFLTCQAKPHTKIGTMSAAGMLSAFM